MMLVMVAVFILTAASRALFDRVLNDCGVGGVRRVMARGMESVIIGNTVGILLAAPFFSSRIFRLDLPSPPRVSKTFTVISASEHLRVRVDASSAHRRCTTELRLLSSLLPPTGSCPAAF